MKRLARKIPAIRRMIQHPEYFTKSEIISERLIPSPELELIGPVALHTLPVECPIDTIVFPERVDRRRRHVVLNDGQVQWTSIMLFLRVRHNPAQVPGLRSAT